MPVVVFFDNVEWTYRGAAKDLVNVMVTVTFAIETVAIEKQKYMLRSVIKRKKETHDIQIYIYIYHGFQFLYLSLFDRIKCRSLTERTGWFCRNDETIRIPLQPVQQR